MENVFPQEVEAVLSIPDGTLGDVVMSVFVKNLA